MVNPEKRKSGKPTTDTSIQHFSHEHQLILLNIKTQPNLNLGSCAACKLKPSKWVYACQSCNYILHVPCSQMPKHIQHPSDPDHTFTLLTEAAYSTGLFSCNACGNEGDGFNYHCSTCEQDIHAICATMPVSLTHETHPCLLNLEFSPSSSKDFSCDVCHGKGSNHWVYSCNPCGFNAHLNCGTYKSSLARSSQSVPQHPSQSVPQYPSQSVSQHPSPSVPQHPSPSVPQYPSQAVPQYPSQAVPQHQTRSLVQPQPQSPLYQQSQPPSPFHRQQSLQPAQGRPVEQVYRQQSLQPAQGRPVEQIYHQQSLQPVQGRPVQQIYRQQSLQPARGRQVEQVYRQQSLQPAQVNTMEQSRQNFIHEYTAAQLADQARILSMLQGNNGVMNPAQLQNIYNNSATNAVIQRYLQSTLAANSNSSAMNPMTQQYLQAMLASSNPVDPNLLASIIGGNNGAGGSRAGQPFNQGFGGGRGGGQNFFQKILGGSGAGRGRPGANGGSSLLRTLFGGF